MAPRATRSKPAPASSPSEKFDSVKLPPSDDQPPQLFVLPSRASPDSRFVSLANPVTTSSSRYLYCPETGFYELTAIGHTSGPPKSCLLAKPLEQDQDGAETAATSSASTSNAESGTIEDGYVLQNAQLLVATPFDPTFFLLSLFTAGASQRDNSKPQLARTPEDHLETLAQTSKHMEQLLRRPAVRQLFEIKLAGVCEAVDAVTETAYRPNINMLARELLQKAKSAVSTAWPRSLERHVQKQLEFSVPIESLQKPSQDAAGQDPHEETPAKMDDIAHKFRIRTALNFLLESYVPIALRTHLSSIFQSNEYFDFSDLDAHLSHVQKLKDEVTVLRSFSDNISRKRGVLDDDEAAEARAEKKRKKEEDEKKQKAESRASKQLKKVNVSGMQKLSAFFTKKTSEAPG